MTEPNTEPPSPAGPTPASSLTTGLERRWLLRTLFMIALLLGFALWGLYDATVAYPNRGIEVADGDLRELIRLAASEGKSDQVSTPDPVAEFKKLNDRAEQTPGLKPVEQAKQRWLEALSRVGRLKPEHTVIPNLAQTKARLDAAAADPSKPAPTRLSAWDIPAQWAITVVCGVLGLWILALLARVAATKYRWNPETRTLSLPGGHAIAPGDVTEFDKRKWHKFLIDLKVRPGHPTLGGKTVRLDLYRHSNLEKWVLDMEQAATPHA